MATDFSAKIVLITGGGMGIGRAATLAFARQGAEVVIADVNEENGQETIALVEKAGGCGIFIKANSTTRRCMGSWRLATARRI